MDDGSVSLPPSSNLFANSTASVAGVNQSSSRQQSSAQSKSKRKDKGRTANPSTDASVTPAIRQAKEDLLRLGIELDDELITRLQNNLGIDKIFKVAHDAATVLAPQPALDIANQNQEIVFRHVSHGNTKVGFSLDTKQPVHSSLQPFVSDMIAIDPKHSIQILKQLDNRTDEVEPQYRPLLDHMIQTFRLQYSRAPCRFIGRLLGRKWNSAADKSQEDQLITRWILKTRYVTKQDFQTMILRVAPKAKIEVVNTLFALLREEKQFGNPQRQSIVDLWAFLTLLKTASEESRRSFDGNQSKLANDVEFWRRANDRSVLGMDPNNHVDTYPEPRAYHGLPPQPPISEGWRLFENLEADNIRHCSSGETSLRRSSKGLAQRAGSGGPQQSRAPSSVAQLLGQNDHRHVAQRTSGRQVTGTLESEVVNTCDVPTALNSPPHLQRRRPTATLPHDVFTRESHLPIAPANNMLDSRNVAYLMNNQRYLQQTVHHSRDRTNQQSFNALHREHLLDNTSVAQALGRQPHSTAPIPPSPQQQRKESRGSLAAYLAPQSNPTSGTTSSDGNQQKPPSATSNTSTSSSRNSNGVRPTRAQSAGRGMRLTSAIDLHWEHSRPSVAAALGHPTS